MLGANAGWVSETPGGDEFRENIQVCAGEIRDAAGLVRHVERPPAQEVLSRDASRTTVGVARDRLNAAEREHEAASAVAPLRAKLHLPRDVEAAHDLALDPAPYLFARPGFQQRMLKEDVAVAHERAETVHDVERRRARPLLAVSDRFQPESEIKLGPESEPPATPAARQFQPGRSVERLLRGFRLPRRQLPFRGRLVDRDRKILRQEVARLIKVHAGRLG